MLISHEDGFTGPMSDVFAPLDQSLTASPTPGISSHSEDKYFKYYDRIKAHRVMLSDTKRTKAYERAIEENKERFKDKLVLDVGAGTGILSIFAARAGAKHVYAVEFSETAYLAMEIIRENGLSDKITVIKMKVEDVQIGSDIPFKVDIIISEWMGYCLLYESMLDSVIYARDNLMKLGGIMFPERARIYIAGMNDVEWKR